jgi:chemotaxis protein CheX
MTASGVQIPKNLAPFVSGVITTFRILCQVETAPQNAFSKAEKKTNNDISGVVGLVGSNFIGTFAVSFPKATILKMVNNMLGEQYTELNNSVSDAVAEITNIVFGNAKKGLSELNINLEMSIPYTILGKDHLINHNFDGPFIVVPFKSTAGDFFIEIGMKKKEQ